MSARQRPTIRDLDQARAALDDALARDSADVAVQAARLSRVVAGYVAANRSKQRRHENRHGRARGERIAARDARAAAALQAAPAWSWLDADQRAIVTARAAGHTWAEAAAYLGFTPAAAYGIWRRLPWPPSTP